MRFRSGRRTAAGSSRSENLLDQQLNKEQRGDVVTKTENQLADQDPSLPLLKRSISPSSDKRDLDYSKRTPSLFNRKLYIWIKQYCFTLFSPWKTGSCRFYVLS